MTLCICIFSYNRGEFLNNCVASVETCMPGSRIIVFDDNSDDPDTLLILEEIRKRHEIIQPPPQTAIRRIGGLYGNMQSALDYCENEELVCFLQDDTQIARNVPENEVASIFSLFLRYPKLGFLHPFFIKAANLKTGARYPYESEMNLYFRAPSARRSGRYFSALLVAMPARLKKVGWQFARSEPANNRLAKSYFIPMGYLFAPFGMWLPEVPAYRGKKKTLAPPACRKKTSMRLLPVSHHG